MSRQEKVETFISFFGPNLIESIKKNPDMYGYKIDQVPAVINRMRTAFAAGTYNHDSPAIKATCRNLGIKSTRKAIEEFFNKEN